MKTRFDNSKYWVTASGEALNICDMETSHLMNTLKMFITKPLGVTAMLVKDIETNSVSNSVWNPYEKDSTTKESIYNVTSMKGVQVINYAVNSPLGKSICSELESRGVNVVNFLNQVDDSSRVCGNRQ